MVRVLNELADLCRVDNPDYFELCRNSEDVINKLTIDYAAEHGLQTYFEDTYKKSLNETTIEDCLKSNIAVRIFLAFARPTLPPVTSTINSPSDFALMSSMS